MAFAGPQSTDGNDRPATQVRPLCWKVRGLPIHFLASMHFGPQGGFFHGAAAMEAFDGADEVHFEITRNDLDLVPGLARREAGSLREELGPELYSRLVGDPRYDQSFEGIKLPFVVTGLATHVYTEIGLSHQCGVENVLYARAGNNGQEIHGLEAATDQVRSLISIGMDRVTGGLRNMLERPELVTEMRDLLVMGYVQGDQDAMNLARAKMYELYPDVADCLLTAREARWLPKLEAIVRSGRPTMVIVGALHFAGEDGILAALKQHDVVVDRLGE